MSDLGAMEAFAEKMSGGDPEKKAQLLANLGAPAPMLAVNKNASFASDGMDTVSDAVPDYSPGPVTSGSPMPQPLTENIESAARASTKMPAELLRENPALYYAQQKLMKAGEKLPFQERKDYHAPPKSEETVGAAIKASIGGLRNTPENWKPEERKPEEFGPPIDEAARMAAASQALAGQTLTQPQIGQSINYGPSAAQTGALKDANNRLKLATLEAGDAGNNVFETKARNSEGEAKLQDTYQQAIDNSINADKAAEEQRVARKDKYITDIRGLSDSLDGAKEDPDHYKKNMTPGQGIGTALGFIFGGMAEAFGAKGTLDAVQSMVQARIQRDIQAQRQNYEKTKDKYDAKKSEYGVMLKDQDIARDVGAMQLNKRLQEIQSGIKAEMMRGDSRIDRAQGADMLANLDARIASGEQQLAQNAVLRASMPMGKAKSGKYDELFVPTDANGGGFAAATKGEGEKLRTNMDELQQMADVAKQYKSALGGVNTWDRVVEKFTPFSTDDMIKAQGAYTGLLFKAKNAAQLGVLSKSDEELLNNYIRSPEKFSGDSARLSQIEQLISNAEKQRATAGQRHGTTDLQRVTDPTTGQAAYIPQGATRGQGSLQARKVNK